MVRRTRRKSNYSKSNHSIEQQDSLVKDLNTNLDTIKSIYLDCSDVVYRNFIISKRYKASLIYIDGLSNIEEIDKSVLLPLMQMSNIELNEIVEQTLTVSNVKELSTIKDVVEQISLGNPVILIDHSSYGLSFGLSKWEKRSIEEPMAEAVVRGPREGFTESIGVNTSLIRRKIKNPKLKLQSINLGKQTNTQVMIAYMEGLSDKTLIEEVKNRLSRIEIDGIIDSGYIEELIEDHPLSPFPQILSTERPDVVTAQLLEGRVAILVDGTPFVLVIPTSWYSLLQSTDDYTQRFMISTMIRWLRYLFLLIALLLPSVYVAILTYHQEMIPTTLLLSFAQSREQVPFPALVEALLMEVSFEALREAGLRLPKQIGSAVSIVGALVIGDAAVNAGLVSTPMVMVVAITGIASFAIPRYNAAIAIRMLRFPIILSAGTLGFLGIMLSIITIIIHLSSIRSFGVPYLSPMAPMKKREWRDVLIRAPWWALKTRPHLTGDYNKNRQSKNQKPSPNNGGD